MGDLTMGVEEEFFLVDAATGELRPDGPAVLQGAVPRLGEGAAAELHQSQVEIGTPICRDLDEVRRFLRHHRKVMAETAIAEGARLLAVGTHPFSTWDDDPITAKEKYLALEEAYQQLAREALMCGCHVHVGIPDPEAAIDVLNRSRPWLAVLLALSTNSPFWLGADTGHASFRTEVWRRWPQSGPPERFANRAHYDEVVDQLLTTGSIDDPGRLYWDARPSARFPTVEYRVADVCSRVDEAVMLAGLCRALAQTCLDESQAGRPVPDPRPELLRAAAWRAARFGLNDDLVDVAAVKGRPAAEVVGAMLAWLRPALERFGDWEEVSGLVNRALTDGTGADRQRRAPDLRAAVEAAVEETAA